MKEDKNFFDKSLLDEFRKVVNSSNVFSDMPEYKHFWNLICVLMDRLDSAVHFLNEHIEVPKTEEDLVAFLVYATLLKDGIYKFHENIYGIKPKTTENKKWFKSVHSYSGKLFNEETCPCDDTFFEYLRSLSFAHPFETSFRKDRFFMTDGEIHTSPWVITNCIFDNEKDSVGVRVYTSKDDSITDVLFSFNNLKKYLLERYLLLKEFIKWGKDEIIKQNQKWMKTKVDRSGDSITVLNNVCLILDSRFINHYTIDEAIALLNANFKNQSNKNAINFVKEKIENVLEKVCDCVDNLDYEEMENCLNFLYERPDCLHDHAHYELEKIFSYLGDEQGPFVRGSNEEWGLIQAKLFYDRYAHKYVMIDFNSMSCKDIKILIRCSLILGYFAEISI